MSRRLLTIANYLTAIRTPYQCSDWSLSLHSWYQQSRDILMEESLNEQTGKYWKTHDRLYRAYTHLSEAIPNLFYYLNDPAIPATSNRLESFFKHLKEKIITA